MPDIVITEFMDDDAVGALASRFDVHYDPELFSHSGAVAELLTGARGLIVRNRTQVDRALLDKAPSLLAVGRLGVGLDNIDVEACAARNIVVLPAAGANANSVAEFVVGALLVLWRPALMSSSRVVAGEWPRQEMTGNEVAGKTLGLVGLGVIARRVAEKASALGMATIATDPLLSEDDPAWNYARSVNRDTLLRESDAISLHVPLTGETRHLINADALAAMKPEAMLINTSRGGIVDEDALAVALRAGRLGGAALDVFEHEPLHGPDAEFLGGVPNLILTPHIAGLTIEAQRQVGVVTAENIARVLDEAEQ